MNTVAHLHGYYPFSPEVVERVEEVAERQRALGNYQELFDLVGAHQPEVYEADGYAPVDILDIKPKDHDEKRALVVHLPMANPLDPNNMFQVATIAHANPDRRVIAAANPSGLGYSSGKLNHKQRAKVAKGDFSPTVEPLARYLDEQGIERADQAGYSYGVEKAATLTTIGGQAVDTLTVIEPVTVCERSRVFLAMCFNSSAAALDEYVNASATPTFNQAREDSVGPGAYILGLMRPTNLAVAKGLSHYMFTERMHSAFRAHPELFATVAWGTDSELAISHYLGSCINILTRQHGSSHVQPIKLEGQKHALANDIYLQTAIVLEGLRPSAAA